MCWAVSGIFYNLCIVGYVNLPNRSMGKTIV